VGFADHGQQGKNGGGLGILILQEGGERQPDNMWESGIREKRGGLPKRVFSGKGL